MPLLELDRRTLVHLGCPRNIEDVTHMLRTDPYAANRSELAVSKQVQALVKKGYVVDLDEQQNATRLALLAQSHPHTIEMHDETAETFARRLAMPHRHWRIEGKTYMLSQQGLEAIKEPLGEEKTFNTNEAAELINAQRSCVFDGPWAKAATEIPEDKRVWLNPHAGQYMQLPILSSDAFNVWLEQVFAQHAAVWGQAASDELKKKTNTISGGTGWSDVWENQIIDQENQKTRFPALVDPFYIALSILAFTDSDGATAANDGSHKPTYTGYAPAQVNSSVMGAASGGSSSNGSAIAYAACTAGSSTIVAFANVQGISSTNVSGELRKYGTCTSVTVSTTQTPATFATSAYTTTAD
jgi:hypothetical protein